MRSDLTLVIITKSQWFWQKKRGFVDRAPPRKIVVVHKSKFTTNESHTVWNVDLYLVQEN